MIHDTISIGVPWLFGRLDKAKGINCRIVWLGLVRLLGPAACEWVRADIVLYIKDGEFDMRDGIRMLER